MICKNVPAGVPFGKSNPANQREVIDEQNIRKAEVRLSFSARDKQVIINGLLLVFLFLPCVTDVRCVTQNALKSPFVIQSVIHKIV